MDKESTPMDRKPSRSALCPSKGEERAGGSISTRLMYLLILKNNCAPEITCDDYFEPCIGSSIESLAGGSGEIGLGLCSNDTKRDLF